LNFARDLALIWLCGIPAYFAVRIYVNLWAHHAHRKSVKALSPEVVEDDKFSKIDALADLIASIAWPGILIQSIINEIQNCGWFFWEEELYLKLFFSETFYDSESDFWTFEGKETYNSLLTQLKKQP